MEYVFSNIAEKKLSFFAPLTLFMLMKDAIKLKVFEKNFIFSFKI